MSDHVAIIHGMVKRRTNAKVHALDAKTGLTLCGEVYDGEPWATVHEVTCAVCGVRMLTD